MNKIVTSFVLAFVLLSICFAIFDGGGFATTELTANMNASAITPIAVTSTSSFVSPGLIMLGNEKIWYTQLDATHFKGVITRGFEQTTATSHSINTNVYSEDTGLINAALGFNPTAIASTNGFIAAVVIPWDFFTITMPRLILWNYNIFQGDLIIVRTILIAVSMCFYITFAIQLGQTISQVIAR